MNLPRPASGRTRVDRVPGRGFVDASALALRHPSAWPVALAGFLARGGLVLFILPVVVLPTPTGLATLFGPDIIALAIAAPTAGVIRLVVGSIALVIGWLVVASLVGAAADASLAAWARASLVGGGEVPDPVPLRLRVIVRVAAVRLACHVPLAIAGTWAVARIVSAVYREYISPGDLAVPLPLRVVRDVPEAIALLLVAWLVGETLGGLAARAVVLEGRPIGRAIRGALGALALHPLSAGLNLVLTTVAVAGASVPALIAAALVWAQLRGDLLLPAATGQLLATTAAFVGLWLVALVATAAATAFRSTIWTWHAICVRAAAPLVRGAPAPVPEPSIVEP